MAVFRFPQAPRDSPTRTTLIPACCISSTSFSSRSYGMYSSVKCRSIKDRLHLGRIERSAPTAGLLCPHVMRHATAVEESRAKGRRTNRLTIENCIAPSVCDEALRNRPSGVSSASVLTVGSRVVRRPRQLPLDSNIDTGAKCPTTCRAGSIEGANDPGSALPDSANCCSRGSTTRSRRSLATPRKCRQRAPPGRRPDTPGGTSVCRSRSCRRSSPMKGLEFRALRSDRSHLTAGVAIPEEIQLGGFRQPSPGLSRRTPSRPATTWYLIVTGEKDKAIRAGADHASLTIPSRTPKDFGLPGLHWQPCRQVGKHGIRPQ